MRPRSSRLATIFRAPVLLSFEMVCLLAAVSTVAGLWCGLLLATLVNGSLK